MIKSDRKEEGSLEPFFDILIALKLALSNLRLERSPIVDTSMQT